jgi:hypothetical protein
MTTTAAVSRGPVMAPAAPVASAFRADRGLVQIVALLWIYAIYDRARTRVTGSATVAVAHAKQIASTERVLGLNIEHAIQQAALHVPWLAAVCNVAYGTMHLVVPPLVLVVLYRRSPQRYRHWRNIFLVMLGMALLCFWLYPLAPPRLVPSSSHLVDTSATTFSVDHTPVARWIGSTSNSASPGWVGATNPFAAMPSLHVAWAAWASLAILPVLRRRGSRVVAASYPAVIALAVVVTANHWILDAAGGAALVAVAAGVVTAMESLRLRLPTRPQVRVVL